MSVKIDHAALARAISALSSLASSIDTERARVANGTPVATPSMSTLAPHAAWMRDQEPYLQGLHDIAVLLATHGATVSSFTVGTGMSDIKTMLGETLADNVDKGNPNDPEASAAYLALFQRWQFDPATMASFQNTLGPENTLRTLSAWADRPVDLPTGQQVSKDQQALVAAMRQSLVTANEPGGFSDAESVAFAHGLVKAATIPADDYYGRGPYNPSGALNYLLYDQKFNDPFIRTMADDLDQYERQDNDGHSGLWSNRPDQDVSFDDYMNWGTTDPYSGNADPMTGLMSAMSHNPSVALDFFADDDAGKGETPRAEYYIKDRNWDRDDYQGISQVLDAASTDPSVTQGSPEHQTAAAKLASQTVEYFSERDNKDDLPEILHRFPENGASENFAHILATYMPGVDRGIDDTGDIREPGAGPQRFDAFHGNLANVPVFDRDGLKNFVLMSTATDQGLAEVTNGINHWRGENLGALADDMAAHPDGSQSALRDGIQDDARLQGFLLSTMGEDKIHDAHEQDQRTKATIDMFSDVVDLVPVPGMSHVTEGVGKDVLNYAIDQGKGAGFDSLEDHLATAEGDAVDDYNTRADSTLDRQKFTVAQLLADHDLLGDKSDLSDVTRDGNSVVSYDQYAAMDDVDKRTVASELFSSDIGVGKYMDEHDYREAFREMFFKGYFGKEQDG